MGAIFAWNCTLERVQRLLVFLSEITGRSAPVAGNCRLKHELHRQDLFREEVLCLCIAPFLSSKKNHVKPHQVRSWNRADGAREKFCPLGGAMIMVSIRSKEAQHLDHPKPLGRAIWRLSNDECGTCKQEARTIDSPQERLRSPFPPQLLLQPQPRFALRALLSVGRTTTTREVGGGR